jgi:two-component system, response regulator
MNPLTVDIVLIEDNNYDAELTIRSLTKNNITCKILVLEDGEKALDYFFCRNQYNVRNIDEKPNLILLDLKLPKVDGLEVLKELKSNEKTKQIPIVILTSSREEQDIVNSYKFGVNSYIVKPVDFHKFSKTLNIIASYWMLLNEPPK